MVSGQLPVQPLDQLFGLFAREDGAHVDFVALDRSVDNAFLPERADGVVELILLSPGSRCDIGDSAYACRAIEDQVSLFKHFFTSENCTRLNTGPMQKARGALATGLTFAKTARCIYILTQILS